MTNKRFKDCLVEFDKAKQKMEREIIMFKLDIKEFMINKGIPVKVLFFGEIGETFGLEIDLNRDNWEDVPSKIPLDVLTDFCNEFGCDFEYTNCNGHRWIFSFKV